MELLRTLRKLVLGETWVLPIGVLVALGVVGLLRDASGSYALPFYGCIALELIAAVLIMLQPSLRAKRSNPA